MDPRIFSIQGYIICEWKQFYFFLSNLDNFTSFSSLSTLLRVLSKILNSIDESRHPGLVPDLRRETFTVTIKGVVICIKCPLSGGRIFHLFLSFWELSLLFQLMSVGFCQILFSVALEILTWFLSFILFIICITLTDFCILSQPYITWINLTYLWYIILYMLLDSVC